MARLQDNLAISKSPAVRKYLDMLAQAEGADYGTKFGGEVTNDLSDHPRTRKGFTQTDGKKNTSSAAGRYQFLEKTWDDVAGAIGARDFSPESQDAAAVELLRRSGSLAKVQAGNYDEAIKLDNKTWASLPGSPYAQKTRSPEFVAAALGGKTAGKATRGAGNKPVAVPQDAAGEPVEVAETMAVPELPPELQAAPPTAVAPIGGADPWQEFMKTQKPVAVAKAMPEPMANWGAVPQAAATPDFFAGVRQGPMEVDFRGFGAWGGLV